MSSSAKVEDLSPWPICSICQSIPLSLFDPLETTELASDELTSAGVHTHALQLAFDNLQRSAYGGCHTCTLFHDAVYEPFKSRLSSAPIFLESVRRYGESPAIVLTAELDQVREASSGEGSLKSIKARIPTSQQPKHIPIGEVRSTMRSEDLSAKNYINLINVQPDNQGVVKFVRECLSTCLRDHNYTCNMVAWPQSATTTQQDAVVNIVATDAGGLITPPTRLIDVGSDKADCPPRLVEGTECLKYGRGYFALSYCNGQTPPQPAWQTTSRTMSSFQEEIPLAVLPQTLHDAIIWTRMLGERYVWIDNLCSIQDSHDDWERESSRMASIYGSALCTLVAASSNVYGGMTDLRNPLKYSAASILLNNPSRPSMPGRVVHIVPNRHTEDKPPLSQSHTRAWCFQEDALSPRLVDFSIKQAQWQCIVLHSERTKRLARLTSGDKRNWYGSWYQSIENYSRRQLTYAADKLPAFSGFATKGHGRYLAGILEEDLWIGLLWVRDESLAPRHAGQRYDNYVAPSWSWASINAGVSHPLAKHLDGNSDRNESANDAQLVNAEVKASGINPTGAVESGKLVLSVKCIDSFAVSKNPLHFAAEDDSASSSRKSLVSGDCILGEITFDVGSEARDGLQLVCLLLRFADKQQQTDTGIAAYGLGVVPQEDSTSLPPEYKRIGFVTLAPGGAGLGVRKQIDLT